MTEAETPDPNPFAKLAAVLAGGSVILTGVLGFLGIKDAALDRVLRQEPRAVLLFGAMIALGLVCGLIAQMITLPGSVRVAWVAVACTAIIVLFPVAANRAREIPVPGGDNLQAILWVAVAAGLVVLVLVGRLRLATNACLLALGGVLFALGTYGAIRIAVTSKSYSATPEFASSTIARKDDGLLHLSASVVAEGLSDCQVLRVSAGTQTLGEASGGPDGKAEMSVDALVTGLMTSGHDVIRLKGVVASVDGASCASRDEQSETLPPRAASVYLPVLPQLSGPSLTGTWTDASTLNVTVAGADDVGPGTAAVIALGRASATCEVLGFAVVPVGGSGDLSVGIPVKVPPLVTEIEIRAGYIDSVPSSQPEPDECDAEPSGLDSTLLLRRPSLPPTN